MKLSVCIPMYNESAIAAEAVKTFSDACEKILPGDWEVIFCDDGSRDGCGDIVRGSGIGGVRVVGYEDNRGKGSAVRTAIAESRGDIVVVTDCDNAYGTDKIAEVVKIMEADGDTDVVIGTRVLDPDGYAGYSFLRRVMSRTYMLVLKLAAGFRHSDSQCGFKAWRGDAARRVFKNCKTDGWAFDVEALLIAEKMGMKVTEFPVRVINNRESQSRINPLRDAVRMLRDLRKIKKYVQRGEF